MALVLSLRDGDAFETRGRTFVARHLTEDGSFCLVLEGGAEKLPGELQHMIKVSCEEAVVLVPGVRVSAGRRSRSSMVQAVIEASPQVLVNKLEERRPKLCR